MVQQKPGAEAPGSACQKSPFGPFSPSCFQNCKIKLCSMILQFCRCGGLLNAKGHPDGFLSHFSSLRSFWLGRFFDSLRHTAPWLRASVHYLRDSPPFPAGCTFGVRLPPHSSECRHRPTLLPESFCIPLRRRAARGLSRTNHPTLIQFRCYPGAVLPAPYLQYHFLHGFVNNYSKIFSGFCLHCTKMSAAAGHKFQPGGIYFPASLCYHEGEHIT